LFIAIALTGLPIFLSFLMTNIVFLYMIGGFPAVGLIPGSILSALTSFVFVPILFFIFMGEVFNHSGVGRLYIDGIDKLLGRVPGRLSIVGILGGTVFSTMSGSSIATTAMMSSMLVPEMKRRGYSNLMSCGPVLGSGGLAMVIPPSALAVILASIAGISVAQILIAGILPGLLIALLYLTFVVAVAIVRPELAPAFESDKLTVRQRVLAILPVSTFSIIVFLVVGLILLGVATPGEASALGAVGTVLLAATFGRMNRQVFVRSLRGTGEIVSMVLIIVASAGTFSEVLALSGASRGLAEWASTTPLSPMLLVVLFLVIVLILGTFMESNSIMMIVLPVFVPLIRQFDLNTLWFGIMVLLCLEMGQTTPPFGLLAYVMKGIIPSVPLRDIFISASPFLVADAVVLLLVFFWPQFSLWLPSLIR
jgi:tripartite ATP-independent transporter DctM subunit